MAERVLQHVAIIPAGTTIAAPVTVALGFDDWDVEAIDLEVPPGPSGCMGFYLANNGQPWIPRAQNEWIVWDDHKERFTPTGYPTGTGWQLVGYNVGKYDHAVICRFHVNPTASPAGPAEQLPVLTFVEHDVKPAPIVTL